MTKQDAENLERLLINKRFETEETNRVYTFIQQLKPEIFGESHTVIIENSDTNRIVGMNSIYLNYIDDKVNVFIDDTNYTISDVNNSEDLLIIKLFHSDEHSLILHEIK